MDQFKSFINRKLYRVRGFMHPSDALAYSAILSLQAERGWEGAHAEIGVFYGRSLALMAHDATRRGSKVLGIDLFDIPGQLDYVEDRMGDLGAAPSVALHVGSSLEPAAREAVERIGPVRMFSIDGGHELHHIANDAELALGALSAQGVVAFDDFMNPQYPDLSRGILRFLEANDTRLVPFAITRAKLYCASPQAHGAYRDALDALDPWCGMWTERFSFLDRDVVHINQPQVVRAIYQTLAERGLGEMGTWLAPTVRREFARQ